jgi:hypothetical protein
VALMLVDMERSYITAGFFRYVMARRAAAAQQQAVLQQALAKGQGGGGGRAGNGRKGLAGYFGGGSGDAQASAGGWRWAWETPPCRPAGQRGTAAMLSPLTPSLTSCPQAKGGGAPSPPPSAASRSFTAAAAAASPGSAAAPAQPPLPSGSPGSMGLSSLADPSDYLAVFLDKKVNEDSARGSLPVQGWRWQRRFFIVSDSQSALFYFKSERGGQGQPLRQGRVRGRRLGWGGGCTRQEPARQHGGHCNTGLAPCRPPRPPPHTPAPDDVAKPNGLRARVDLSACVVEDLDENGYGRAQVGAGRGGGANERGGLHVAGHRAEDGPATEQLSNAASPAWFTLRRRAPQVGSAMVELQRGDRASLLLRVRSVDARRPCLKGYNT